MTNVVQALAQAKAVVGEKYERRVSLEGLIRRLCDRDHAVAYAAMIYARRWAREPTSLWEDDQGAWIAQPLRCHAMELDMAESQVKVVLTRLVRLGLFETKAAKLYPTAIRRTTHLRPTPLFRLFLHRIGWLKTPALAGDWEKACGPDLDKKMDRTATWPESRLCTQPQSRLLMETVGKETISLSEKKVPAAALAGASQVLEMEVVEEKQMPLPKEPKTPHTAGFKGGGSSSYQQTKPPSPTGVKQALSAVLNKAPSSPTGAKQKLWARVAVLVHKTGRVFPIKAPPMQMARLWKMRQDVMEEYGSEEVFWNMIAAAAGDWETFGAWMKANSSLAKGAPESLDVLWLQFHRQKAIEYATGVGADVAKALRSDAPVQSVAPAAPGTDLKAAGWNAQ